MDYTKALEQALANASATGSRQGPAFELFNQHAGLPDVLRNKVPWGIGNKFVYLVFDKLLPLLGLRWVKRSTFEYEGKTYQRITMYVPGRRIDLTLTPVAAFYVGKMLSMMAHSGYTGKRTLVFIDDGVGYVAVPPWATYLVLDALADICKEHEPHVKLVVDAIHQAFLGTAKMEAEAEAVDSVPLVGDQQPNKPTLH